MSAPETEAARGEGTPKPPSRHHDHRAPDGRPRDDVRRALRDLYYGRSPAARRFRFAVMIFDFASITYFITTSVTATAEHYQFIDFIIGIILLIDLVVRTQIAHNPLKQVRHLSFWIDCLVIVALFGSAFLPDLDFVRVLRMLRVLRSYRLLYELRGDFIWFRQQEEVIESAVNLIVFIFVITSLVYVVEHQHNPQFQTFLDALYFTITTLTTTGFGDITVDGTWGRLLAIFIMLFGVGLFLRLLQAVFRPTRVSYDCPRCGLERHDLDAVHCKHCGEILNIPTEGAV
ncbi:potassium channel family protein [Acuticoccus kandeliae]|uniref:potassium channel family protein n=1 Tax=Acuticoccus kandeliae TaxID=2073160 RepID=UPI001FE5CE30|nr:potassium channel family protein [Acuticoccus kandeliae]